MDYMNTEKEWEMLSAIDDDLTSGCNDAPHILETLTNEEVTAMVKWINRNGTNKYFPLDGDYNNRVAASFVLEEYIYLNTIEAIGNLEKVDDMRKVWEFICNL